MKKIKDETIKQWLKNNERFEGRAVNKNLYIRFRKSDTHPTWRFRYSFAGKPRIMSLGNYYQIPRSDAEKQAKLLSARVSLGYDVAAEKQQRKSDSLKKMNEAKNVITVGVLADMYYERNIAGRIKHPNIIRSKIDKIIRPRMGNMPLEAVSPKDIDNALQAIVARGTPTVANNLLRLFKRIFNFAIKRGYLQYNPASAFDLSDAGGADKARERALSEDELVVLFTAMRQAKGFSIQNYLTFKLLLLLPVRKMELAGARWDEFDLENGVWHLHGNRTKTGAATDIPLAPEAIEALLELKRLAYGSNWVLPARQVQTRMLPHICESTLSRAMGKVNHGLDHFTIHDLRRTARTHLARLKAAPHVAEVCLNHKPAGMQGIYDRHTYYDERKEALAKLAVFIVSCEQAGIRNSIAA